MTRFFRFLPRPRRTSLHSLTRYLLHSGLFLVTLQLARNLFALIGRYFFHTGEISLISLSRMIVHYDLVSLVILVSGVLLLDAMLDA